jgi:hypothetical protein
MNVKQVIYVCTGILILTIDLSVKNVMPLSTAPLYIHFQQTKIKVKNLINLSVTNPDLAQEALVPDS